MKPVETLLFISGSSGTFCSYLTSFALTGITLILGARAGEIWSDEGEEECCEHLTQDHTLHQLALLHNSSPANYLALLQYASIRPHNCWELYHVDGILENYTIMSILLFKTYFLNSIMWTVINSGRLRTGLWNYCLVYLINLLHQNTK